MKSVYKGVVLGLVFGILDVILMLPLPLPNKNMAMLSAFFGRFAIGFLIPLTNLSVSSWKKGVILGILLSLSDAIITNAFGPIMLTGVVGGFIMGIISDRIPDDSKSM